MTQTVIKGPEGMYLKLLGAVQKGSLQIFDLKQVADIEARVKMDTLKHLREYRAWKKYYGRQTDLVELHFGNLRGRLLRQQAVNAVGYYWHIRQQSRQLFAAYHKQIESYRPYFKAA